MKKVLKFTVDCGNYVRSAEIYCRLWKLCKKVLKFTVDCGNYVKSAEKF